MKKRSNNIKWDLFLTIFLIFLVSLILINCKPSNERSRIKIHGYSIGDSISDDFKVIKVLDFPFSNAIYIQDTRLNVSLINNHIYYMAFTNITNEEYINLKEENTKKLRITPVHSKDYFYGVKIKGESYKWIDSITGDNISMGKDSLSNVLIINNSIVFKELSEDYVPNYDTLNEDIEIIEE